MFLTSTKPGGMCEAGEDGAGSGSASAAAGQGSSGANLREISLIILDFEAAWQGRSMANWMHVPRTLRLSRPNSARS